MALIRPAFRSRRSRASRATPPTLSRRSRASPPPERTRTGKCSCCHRKRTCRPFPSKRSRRRTGSPNNRSAPRNANECGGKLVSFYEQPQRILLSAKVGYMVLTLVLALLFNLLPWRDLTGLPDMVALVLTFWCVHQPRKMGIGFAWFVGLVMDAGNGALLGQHAFAYAFLAFAAVSLHRRILWFSPWRQAAHVLVLLLATQILMLAVRLVAGGMFPGLTYFAGTFIAAALWPLASLLLLLPQRRRDRVDGHRPIRGTDGARRDPRRQAGAAPPPLMPPRR